MDSYSGDSKAAFNSAAIGSAGKSQLVPLGQRARLRSLTLGGPTATITLVNGSGDGTDVVFTVNREAYRQNPLSMPIPGSGVLFDNGIAVKAISAASNFVVGTIVITYEG